MFGINLALSELKYLGDYEPRAALCSTLGYQITAFQA
jgi:hypothetical protein